ncbi:MAG: hypothetical protein C4289_06800 [Chloroflexota bacterium]
MMQFLLYNEMLANLATGGCMHNWNIRFENCEILAAAWRKAPHGVPPGAAPHRASERGQTLVEFALVSLVLFLLLLGLIDFGRALWMFSSVSLASREAARAAMVRGGQCLANSSSATCLRGTPVAPTTGAVPCNDPLVNDPGPAGDRYVVVAVACRYLAGFSPADARVQVSFPPSNSPPPNLCAPGTTATNPIDEGLVQVTVWADYRPVSRLIFQSVGQFTLCSTSVQKFTF